MKHRILPLALASAVLLPSCILNANSHTVVSGHYVSAETMSQIQPGKKQDYVLALLGDPSTRTTLSDGVAIWKWQYTEKRTSSGSLIFVIDSDSTNETVNATFVEFKDGIVTKAWRD